MSTARLSGYSGGVLGPFSATQCSSGAGCQTQTVGPQSRDPGGWQFLSLDIKVSSIVLSVIGGSAKLTCCISFFGPRRDSIKTSHNQNCKQRRGLV